MSLQNIIKEGEGWKNEFREYFDKTLKPKKPTMKNLDRELCVNFIENLLSSRTTLAYKAGVAKAAEEAIQYEQFIENVLQGLEMADGGAYKAFRLALTSRIPPSQLLSQELTKEN